VRSEGRSPLLERMHERSPQLHWAWTIFRILAGFAIVRAETGPDYTKELESATYSHGTSYRKRGSAVRERQRDTELAYTYGGNCSRFKQPFDREVGPDLILYCKAWSKFIYRFL
jgi:hypothetical protein